MNNSIGAALRAARERRQLTLAQVSETTRIRSPYLQALEADDLSAMTSAAQARGFLKIYAQFLHLDLETLIPPISAPGPEAQPAAETPTAPAPKPGPLPARPSLLTRLRQRIAPRGAAAEADSKAAGPDPAVSTYRPAPATLPSAKGEVAPQGKKKGRG